MWKKSPSYYQHIETFFHSQPSFYLFSLLSDSVSSARVLSDEPTEQHIHSKCASPAHLKETRTLICKVGTFPTGPHNLRGVFEESDSVLRWFDLGLG